MASSAVFVSATLLTRPFADDMTIVAAAANSPIPPDISIAPVSILPPYSTASFTPCPWPCFLVPLATFSLIFGGFSIFNFLLFIGDCVSDDPQLFVARRNVSRNPIEVFAVTIVCFI